MDKAGIFDSAFIVTACRRSVSLEFTHLFTLRSFGGLSLRRKIRSIASYHHGFGNIVGSVHQCLVQAASLLEISATQSVSK